MSRSYHVNYELERRRRQALAIKKAAETAEMLLRRYQSKHETMVGKGYKAYIPDEVARLERDLSSVREMLANGQSFEARNLAQNVGAYIGEYDVIANTAISQYERAERIRTEQARIEKNKASSSLMDIYLDMVGKIDDPVVANFALPRLQEISGLVEKDGESAFSEDSLKKAILDAIDAASEKASKFQREEEAKRQQACLQSQIADIEAIHHETKFESKETSEEFSTRISAIKEKLSSGSFVAGLDQEISQVGNDMEDAVISEEARREAVKAIYQQLKSQEFTVEAPRRFVVDGSDYVRIVARRPSGKQAVCDIDNHGSIKYKFDKYDGMTCLKDIERFNVDLEKIYSLKLTDERVLWSNPDRLTRDANETSEEGRRTL